MKQNLRLNSTENNLERVKDVLKTQDEQLEILKKQSKQAEDIKIFKKILHGKSNCFLSKMANRKKKIRRRK